MSKSNKILIFQLICCLWLDDFDFEVLVVDRLRQLLHWNVVIVAWFYYLYPILIIGDALALRVLILWLGLFDSFSHFCEVLTMLHSFIRLELPDNFPFTLNFEFREFNSRVLVYGISVFGAVCLLRSFNSSAFVIFVRICEFFDVLW